MQKQNDAKRSPPIMHGKKGATECKQAQRGHMLNNGVMRAKPSVMRGRAAPRRALLARFSENYERDQARAPLMKRLL